MPSRHLSTPAAPAQLREQLAALRAELEVPDGFAPEVIEAAERAASGETADRLPELDRTDIPLVTIDPEGSQDLDQALYLERDGDTIVVWYAIADLPAFVTAGDPIDVEARKRGQTLYGPDLRVPLHPQALSEGAASLLPDQTRPSYLWRIVVGADGEIIDATVERSLVRSTAQLNYHQVQEQLDNGTTQEWLRLLAEVGKLREQVEQNRGGISLNLPDQEIDTGDGEWKLVFRELLPVEGWNAQISLLTGIAAARIMLEGKVGIVRTLPPADGRSIRRLRETARALEIDWPEAMDYPEFVRALDPARADHVAMLNACTTLFRGAGYHSFDGELPEQRMHAALATEYAHCTAPLRRLGDRWALEICARLCAGEPIPAWVKESLEAIPQIMTSTDQRANRYENAVVSLVEAYRLAPHVGETFQAVIVDVDDDGERGQVMLREPAVEARVTGADLPLGKDVTVRLEIADPDQRRVEFSLA